MIGSIIRQHKPLYDYDDQLYAKITQQLVKCVVHDSPPPNMKIASHEVARGAEGRGKGAPMNRE